MQICDKVVAVLVVVAYKLAFIRWVAVLSWFVKGHSPSFITSMDKSEKKHTQKSTHLLS